MKKTFVFVLTLLFASNFSAPVYANAHGCSYRAVNESKSLDRYISYIGKNKRDIMPPDNGHAYVCDNHTKVYCGKNTFRFDSEDRLKSINIFDRNMDFKGARIGDKVDEFLSAFPDVIDADKIEGYYSFNYKNKKMTVFYHPGDMKTLNVFIEEMPERKKIPEGVIQLPESIGGVYLGDNLDYLLAETEANKELELFVKNAYGMQDADFIGGNDRYYYNLIDLNDDGVKEIFVYLVGRSFSGTGGSSALILAQHAGGYHVISKLSLVRNPVIISSNSTNGWHDLVLQVAGGGAQYGLVELKFDGEKYPSNPSTQEYLANGRVVVGTAIIADDLTKNKGILLK